MLLWHSATALESRQQTLAASNWRYSVRHIQKVKGTMKNITNVHSIQIL